MLRAWKRRQVWTVEVLRLLEMNANLEITNEQKAKTLILRAPLDILLLLPFLKPNPELPLREELEVVVLADPTSTVAFAINGALNGFFSAPCD